AFASEEKDSGQIADNPMFDLTGVRFVISGGAQPGSTAQFRQVAESDGARVYENSRRIARAFIVHDLIPAKDHVGAVKALESHSRQQSDGSWRITDLDPRRTAVVEGVSQADVLDDKSCPTPARVSITGYSSQRVTVQADS